jgi:phosphoribosylformylglycinamidine synthase
MVQTNTVSTKGADAAVIKLKETNKALAISIDGQGRYCYLNPYEGSKIAVAEAARNVVMAGAKPLAVTDCLNFGNPEKPEIFWQFSQTIDGIADTCKALELPIVSGNVSFYNESYGKAIFPTPIIGIVGLIEDLSHFTTVGFKEEGDLIYLAGETFEELGASEYLRLEAGIFGKSPSLDLEKEAALHGFCLEAIKNGLVKSAHDLSDGGLVVSIVESAIAGNLGAEITLEGNLLVQLFSESQSRALITINPKNKDAFEKLAKDIKLTKIGTVSRQKLIINDKVDLELSKLKDTYENSLEKLLK